MFLYVSCATLAVNIKTVTVIKSSHVLSSVPRVSMACMIALMVAKPAPQHAKIDAYLDKFACFLQKSLFVVYVLMSCNKLSFFVYGLWCIYEKPFCCKDILSCFDVIFNDFLLNLCVLGAKIR